MKIIFVRHGEPDYNDVTQRGFIGHGRDLAHLTKLGKAQAQTAAENSILDGIELIVSSPYTRALQTAAIISKYRDIEIEVELDLHQWLSDLTYSYSAYDSVDRAFKLCIANKGICPKNSPIKYEELSSVFDRAKKCLEKYTSYKKIAVVAHGMLMCQFAFSEELTYCGMLEVEFDKNFEWSGWIDTIQYIQYNVKLVRTLYKRRTNNVITFFGLTTYNSYHILTTLPIGHHLEYKN